VLALTWALPRGATGSSIFIIVGLLGIGMAGHWCCPGPSCLTSSTGDEAHHGVRRVGTYYGLLGLADKLARTLSFVSVGWFLGASGFVANVDQTPNALMAIRALFGPGPALLVLLAVPLLFRFPITRAAHAQARAKLDASARVQVPTTIRPPLARRLLTRFALSFFKVPRDAVRFGLKRFSTRTALVTGGRSLTFGQLNERVGRLVGAMERRGVSKRSIVLMALDDGPELIELRYAAMEAGVVLTAVAPWATAAQVEQLRRLGEPAMLFSDARLPLPLKAALGKLPLASNCRIETGESWDALLAEGPPQAGPRELLPSDVAGLGFTSGTTGEPKVLAMPQGALLKSLALTATNVGTPIGKREVMLSAIPLNGAGSGLVLPLALTGATLVIPTSRDPSLLVETLRSEQVTRAFVTPSQLLDLLDEPGFTRQQLPHLRNIIYGTAAMPVPRLEEAIERMGPIFQQGYGMAEVLPPVSLLQMEHHQIDGQLPPREVLRSVGWVVPEVQVRVVNAQLEDVPAGHVGEVLVKSPTVFEGYWKLEGVDRSVFHQGYLRTGDYGLLTADRRLTVLDRRADLLCRGGRVLYPRLLEEVAYGEPEVKEACMVQGAPDAPLVLVVSPRRGCTVDVESLQQRYEQQADPEERPDEIRVMRALPRSPLQKLLRREIRSLLAFV
jgi:fatty-acyl-CoA synthase